MRFAKIFRLGGSRYDVGVDLYNMLNANAATGFEETYELLSNGAEWLTPDSIMAPRILRFNVTVAF
jgi:hypothetical protein